MAYINFQPSDHFNTKQYTGTGAEHAITGIGFQPDFVWHKRSDSTSDHHLYDSIRGATHKFQVESGASNVDAQTLKSFDSDGFTLGTRQHQMQVVEHFKHGLGKLQVQMHQMEMAI